MDGYSIDRIRNAKFSHAVRGYDRYEVDQFLGELADWLEGGGGEGGPAAEQVREELAQVGEQVAGILTEAHDAAQSIRDDASSEMRQSLVNANVTAESLRTEADEYAGEAREDADAYARKARADADEYGQAACEEAEADAREQREAARAEAEKIVAEANQRKRDVEAVISDLTERRDAVLSELEQLASGIAGAATRHRPDTDTGEAGEVEASEAEGSADANGGSEDTEELPASEKPSKASSRDE